MKPANCIERDDCVRACVASILEMETQEVPHFFRNVEIGQFEMQQWLADRNMIAGLVALPGSMTFEALGEWLTARYRDTYYMLWCNSADGDHSIVGVNGTVAYNPAWYKCGIDGPHSSGFWLVWIIARVR